MAAAPPRAFHRRRMGSSSVWAAPPRRPSASAPRPLPQPRMSIRSTSPSLTLHISPPPRAQQQQAPSSTVAPFRPSIAIVVGVLTTMFSITFLLLLYAKHCKRGSPRNGGSSGAPNNNVAAARRNSGVERCVVESLPLFRFGVLVGQKAEAGGLECAVCLNRFDPAELLRLLPKCKHAFHVECVDTWLDAHSTCPLCRCRVDPEDAFLIPPTDPKMVAEAPVGNDREGDVEVQQQKSPGGGGGELAGSGEVANNHSGCGPFNLRAGRHSSAGEKSSGSALLQVVVERPGRRKSIDDAILRNAAVQPLRRKDCLLLTTTDGAAAQKQEEMERRFGHCIVVSDTISNGSGGAAMHRWSDLKPSDLLVLRREMILSAAESARYSAASGRARLSSSSTSALPSAVRPEAIDGRCASEITGLSRQAAAIQEEREQALRKKWQGFSAWRTGLWPTARGGSNGPSR